MASDQHDRDYCQPWQVELRIAAEYGKGGVCIDESCELSGYQAHAGPCEPCGCPKNHAIMECPLLHGEALLCADRQRRKATATDLAERLVGLDDEKTQEVARLIVGWFCRQGPDYMRMKLMEDGRILPRRTNTPAEVARGGRLLIFWALRREV